MAGAARKPPEVAPLVEARVVAAVVVRVELASQPRTVVGALPVVPGAHRGEVQQQGRHQWECGPTMKHQPPPYSSDTGCAP